MLDQLKLIGFLKQVFSKGCALVLISAGMKSALLLDSMKEVSKFCIWQETFPVAGRNKDELCTKRSALRLGFQPIILKDVCGVYN